MLEPRPLAEDLYHYKDAERQCKVQDLGFTGFGFPTEGFSVLSLFFEQAVVTETPAAVSRFRCRALI